MIWLSHVVRFRVSRPMAGVFWSPSAGIFS